MQTPKKLREVGDSFGTITEFSEGYCCESFLLPQYVDLISSLFSFLSSDLITVGIIRYHNLAGLSQVSVPDLGESMIPTLTDMHSVLLPSLQSLNLWQVGLLPLSYDFVIFGL